MEKIIELLKSVSLDDRKLGVILLSKTVSKEEFKRIIESIRYNDYTSPSIIFYTPNTEKYIIYEEDNTLDTYYRNSIRFTK